MLADIGGNLSTVLVVATIALGIVLTEWAEAWRKRGEAKYGKQDAGMDEAPEDEPTDRSD